MIVSKYEQLEGLLLDESLISTLTFDFFSAFRFILSPSRIQEIETLLRSILFTMTTARNRPSPGLDMQGLSLVSSTGINLSRNSRAVYFVLNIILPYIWNVQKSPSFLSALVKAGSLINHILFLKFGIFRCLTDRILDLRVVGPERVPPSLDFYNQDLCFKMISEFCLFIEPFVNIESLRIWLSRLLKLRPIQSINSQTHHCVYCDISDPLIPVNASCGHLFCYYCLSSLRLAGDYHCPCCQKAIEWQKLQIYRV